MNISDKRLIDLIFRDSHTSFVLLDKNYNFIRVNEAYARACGHPVEYFPGKAHFELYPSNAIDIFEQVKKTRQPFSISARPFVFPGDASRGVTYWDWNLEPVLDENGEVDVFVWAINEVTERVKAEKSRDNFFNLSRNLICTATFDGYFVEISPAWAKTLGFAEEELKSRPFVEFVHPDDRHSTTMEARRLSEKPNETVNFLNRYLCKDDGYKWLSWNAIGDREQGLIYAVAHDITELKDNEVAMRKHRDDLEKEIAIRTRELARNEHRLNFLVNNSPAVIYTCDVRETLVPTFVSDNIQQLFDLSPTQFFEDPDFWAKNIHPEDAPGVFKESEKLFLNDRHSHQYRFKKDNDEYVWVHDELRLLRDSRGEPREVIGYWADVTRQKETEVHLREAKLAAEAADKSKSEFISNMSHELRTPLNAIIGFSQILLYDKNIDDYNKEGLKDIYDAGNHLLRLINDILDLSKIDAGKVGIVVEQVSLNDLLHESLSLTRPRATENGIEIVNHISGRTNFTILADCMRFKQVIINLISNAIKYNQPHGKVYLDAEFASPGFLRVRIANTGKTISEENQAKLFQPFERLDAKNSNIEGTGIGLVVSKKLIKSMSGDIGYYVSDEKLSTFWVDIPLREARGVKYAAGAATRADGMGHAAVDVTSPG